MMKSYLVKTNHGFYSREDDFESALKSDDEWIQDELKDCENEGYALENMNRSFVKHKDANYIVTTLIFSKQ